MAEDVTVLIGSLGQLEHLRPCLESIFETTSGAETSLRVILGFNFEGDSDIPAIIRQEFPQVEQFMAANKLGVCRVYNQLSLRRTGRYALLLDDDTILRPGAIETMVRFMDAHLDVGISGCRTVNLDGTYQKSTGLMYNLWTEFFNALLPQAFWRDGIDETVTTWRSVGWLNGAFLMVRTEVIDQVGGFDEHFHLFLHESDWCFRISRAGWKVAYVPEAEVIHIGRSFSVVRPVKSYGNIIRYHVNRYYLCRKHYGSVALQALRPMMSLDAALRLMKYSAVWLLSPNRRPEAGPKVEAFWKVMLLGAARRPDELPEDLQREYDVFGYLQPCFPD